METMMKGGRGRPRKSSYDDAVFFKIFIRHRNSQQLKIPMAYVKEFGGTIYEKTILEGYDGKLWSVNIEKTDEGVFIKNGWINFVNRYSLSEGVFLFFKYIGDSMFLVKIFGTDGWKIEVNKPCEMPSSSKQPSGSNQAQKVSSQFVKQEPVVTEEDPYFIKPVNYQQERSLIIPAVMFTRFKVKVRPEMVFCDVKGKKWPVKIHKCTDGRTLFGCGWKEFWTKNNIQFCDTCKFTFLEGGSSEVIKVEILRGQFKKK